MSATIHPPIHEHVPEHTLSGHQLAPGELATLVAEFGIARFESEVGAAAEDAGRRGAPARLVALTTDRHTPDIVRERAFGRMAAYLPR